MNRIKAVKPRVAPAVTLSNPIVVRYEYGVRSALDRRRIVDRVLVEYQGSDYERYRKSFESRKGARANIPQSGTHATINAVKYQY